MISLGLYKKAFPENLPLNPPPAGGDLQIYNKLRISLQEEGINFYTA